jgi:outer membrane immunogenic protein
MKARISNGNGLLHDGLTDWVLVVKTAAFLGIGLAAAGWPAAAARADDTGARFEGLSLGIHAGAASGRSSYSTEPNCPPTADAVFCNAAPDPSAVNGTAVAASGSGKVVSRGLTGGVQAGYSWQSGRIVYGGEADFAALDFDETATASGAFPFPFLGTQYSVTNKTTLNWVSTLRARLGVTVTPQVLLYATGGAAFARIRFSSTYSDDAIDPTFPGGSGSGSTNSVKTGWVGGGGAQWALDRQWSMKAEYLYADFGSVSVGVPVTNTPNFAQTMSATSSVSMHLMRIGFDYRF